MMLQEPGTSEYDLQFNFFSFHVRVAWGFWIMAAALGWQYSQSLDEMFADNGLDTPGAPMLLLIWIAMVFLSILVHELGHSLAMKRFGVQSRIVLYHFGGLAIPDSFGAWNAGRKRSSLSAKESIIVSAAGPGAQLLLAVLFYAIGRAMRVPQDLDVTLEWALGLPSPAGPEMPTASIYAIFDMLVTTSIFWALLNLLPVLPLDGGNIMQNLLHLFGNRNAMRTGYQVSLVCAAILALYFLRSGNQGAGLMFIMLAVGNWQVLSMMNMRY